MRTYQQQIHKSNPRKVINKYKIITPKNRKYNKIICLIKQKSNSNQEDDCFFFVREEDSRLKTSRSVCELSNIFI